jgi:hemoglobin
MTSDPCESSAAASHKAAPADGEEDLITLLVNSFYDRVHQDAVLAPVFNGFVRDWDQHLAAMRNFWATSLLGSGDYRGNGFVHHMRLPLEEAHFIHWLTLWEQTALEILPAHLAERALKRARHMAQSYRVGLLPYQRADGSLSSKPE